MDVKKLFDRPLQLRECSSCHGLGHVPVPRWLVPHSEVPGAPEGAVTAAVVGSASIFEAIREAREIAARGKFPVAFNFNGKCVVVRPDDDPEQVARAWWIAFHGRTPEESDAQR